MRIHLAVLELLFADRQSDRQTDRQTHSETNWHLPATFCFICAKNYLILKSWRVELIWNVIKYFGS